MAKVSPKISTYLTLEQLDTLSAAELTYINKHGLGNLTLEYIIFLDDYAILQYWGSLNQKSNHILEWHAHAHFKTFVTLRMLLEDAKYDLTVFYFKVHLDEVHRWQTYDRDKETPSPSTIARLISYFIEPYDATN